MDSIPIPPDPRNQTNACHSSSPQNCTSTFNTQQQPLEQNALHTKMDQILSFLEKPHTFLLLLITIITVLSVSLYLEQQQQHHNHELYGVLMACIPLLVYGCLQFRDGMFLRPHVIVWRLVMGISLLYLMLLVYLLMQTPQNARALMNVLDSEQGGIPLPEKSYAQNCELTLQSWFGAFDIFVIGHTAGWFVKSVMIRDRAVLWVASIMFEFMELIFRNVLPNFNECWWDSWILDVALCNAIGIEIGLAFCRFLNAREYHWTYISEKKRNESIPDQKNTKSVHSNALVDTIKRGIQQFSPSTFDTFRWHVLESRFNFFTASCVVFLLLFADLNAFFLKTSLWVASESHLNILRLFIIGFAGFPSAREFYQYVSDPHCTRFGSQAWILSAILLTELCIIFKFGRLEFTQPFTYYFPQHTQIAVVSGIVFYLAVFFFIVPRSSQRKTKST